MADLPGITIQSTAVITFYIFTYLRFTLYALPIDISLANEETES
jgi:hypothetical protein